MYSRENSINDIAAKQSTRFLMDQVQADLSTNLLKGPCGEVRLEPRVMEILGQLAKSAGQVVLRNDLLDEHGSDEGITRAISILRKSLKKVGCDKTKYIETIPKRGYRLIVSVVDSNQMFALSEQESTQQPSYLASLAVLPFLDLSENQDQAYLSDGVSDEIINALAGLSFLRVSGRTSSFSFRGTATKLADIAAALNVSHVLEGSVRKYGNQLRIGTQLIDVAKDKHIWIETFDGIQDDIFDLQENIARAVEGELRRLFGVERHNETTSRLSKKLTTSKEAYNQFLVGRHLMYELSGQRTIPRAIAAFSEAVEHDPKFATAWAHLAIANFTLPEYSTSTDWKQHINTARLQTEHALTLAPDIAWVERARAGILSYDLKLDQALNAYNRALELDVKDPQLLFTNGYIMAAIGLQKQAGEMMSEALDREPLMGSWYGALGTTHFASGELDTAEKLFKKSFDCNFGYGGILYAQLLSHMGRSKEAIDFLNKNFDGFGPVLAEQLRHSFVRKLTYAAFFKKTKFARFMVGIVLTKRMKSDKVQPALGTIVGFLMIGRPDKFFEHILNKPNPYVGFALSRIWEPTDEAKAVRTHADFPMFADKIGLVKAWQKYGWPSTVRPVEGTDGSNGQLICN